jgi:hypothetical protein
MLSDFLANAFNASLLRPEAMILFPCFANRKAVALPIPLLAPVIQIVSLLIITASSFPMFDLRIIEVVGLLVC